MKQHPSGLVWLAIWIAAVCLVAGCGRPAGAPPPGINYSVELEKPHAPASATGTIHAPLDEILTHCVDAHGDVNYVALATDVAQLDAYLSDMQGRIPAPAAASDPAAVSAEKAFWINVYNAAALRNVITAGVPESVSDVPDFFTRPAFAGLSLAQIRDDKLRARFHDPRIHMALTYCARGGPALENHAFVADDLDWRLMRATVNFCLDKTKNSINPTSDVITLSPIFKEFTPEDAGHPRCEFGEDFGTTHRSRRLWMARYVHPSFSRYLKNNVPQRMVYSTFDWKLNRPQPAAAAPVEIRMAPPGTP